MDSHNSPNSSGQAVPQSPDDLVMGTNSSSIVSKRSVERLYYPHEPHFFRFFVPKFQRRAPLINRGYWLRLKAIDTIVHRFLEKPSPLKKVVVNLGCGSDVLPWQCDARWPDLSRDTLFVDVDFRELLEEKRRVILMTPELHRLLGPFESETGSSPVLLRSQRYSQIACDLRQLSLLRETLASLVGGSTSQATFLFVAEVSITYLETHAADDIIEWASTLGNVNFCLLEQIIPDGPENPFARTMLAHFEKLRTPLRSVLQYPDLASQNHRFLSRGWQNVQSWTLWEAWADEFFTCCEERTKLDEIEPFDEWEEFALFASHYLVLWADTSDTSAVRRAENGATWPSNVLHLPSNFTLAQRSPRRVKRRFGAAMRVENVLGQEYISHVMGHGDRSRLSSVDVYSVFPGQFDIPGVQAGGPTARVCHTLTDLGSHGVLLVGGRTSPANALRDCWLYNKVLGYWERAQDLPVPLFRQSVLRLGSSSLALVVGGKTDHHRVSDQSYVFHPQNGWLTCHVQGSCPAVFGAAICLVGGDSRGTFEGILVGGMLPDGTHSQQLFHWALELAGAHAHMVFRTCDSPGAGDAGLRRMLSRFGATCLNHGMGHILLLGGVTAGHQLPQKLDILLLQTSPEGLEIVGSVSGDNATEQTRPFFVGSSVVAHPDGQYVVLGGGATCFSMGTCWSEGTFSFSLAPSVNLSRASPVTYVQTCEIIPGQGPQRQISSAGPLGLTVAAVPRIRLESPSKFSEILGAGLPVVIKGADVGACVSKWTSEYLVQRIGADRKVPVHEASMSRMDFNAKNFRYTNLRFADFMRQVQANGRVYLRALSLTDPSNKAVNLAEDFPSLAGDFQLPTELEMVSRNIHSSVLRISGPVEMWLHYDVMANIYVQVQGSKKLVLFPPRDVTRLAFAPGASSSSIDVFAALEKGTLESVQPFEAVLGPGDMLFLPPFWLHATKPITGLSVAVNVFFRNLEAGYALGKDVYGNRDLAAYEKGRNDVKKIIATFDRLPRDTVEFYIRRLADELLQSIRE